MDEICVNGTTFKLGDKVSANNNIGYRGKEYLDLVGEIVEIDPIEPMLRVKYSDELVLWCYASTAKKHMKYSVDDVVEFTESCGGYVSIENWGTIVSANDGLYEIRCNRKDGRGTKTLSFLEYEIAGLKNINKEENTMEKKFKVGDKVIVVSNNSGHSFAVGDVVTICSVNQYDYRYDYRAENADGERWYMVEWDMKPFVPADEVKEVHITTKGRKVIGVMKKNGVIVNKAEALCHKDDEFNFSVGAGLVMERLGLVDSKNETKTEPKPQYAVGDIVEFNLGYYRNIRNFGYIEEVVKPKSGKLGYHIRCSYPANNDKQTLYFGENDIIGIKN